MIECDTELLHTNALYRGRVANRFDIIENCSETIKALCEYNKVAGCGEIIESNANQAYFTLLDKIANTYASLSQFVYLNNCDKDIGYRIDIAMERDNTEYSITDNKFIKLETVQDICNLSDLILSNHLSSKTIMLDPWHSESIENDILKLFILREIMQFGNIINVKHFVQFVSNNFEEYLDNLRLPNTLDGELKFYYDCLYKTMQPLIQSLWSSDESNELDDLKMRLL